MKSELGLKQALDILAEDAEAKGLVKRIMRYVGRGVAVGAGAVAVAMGNPVALLSVPALLAFRNELSGLSDALFDALPDKWSSRTPREVRYTRLRAAHVVLVWCAWFEAVGDALDALPEGLADELGADLPDPRLPSVPLPHIGRRPAAFERALHGIFTEPMDALIQLLKGDDPPEGFVAFEERAAAVPDSAIQTLVRWQLELARRAPDYLQWLSLHHRAAVADAYETLSTQQRDLVEAMRSQEDVQIAGFDRLTGLLRSLGELVAGSRVTETRRDLQTLMARYRSVESARVLQEGGQDGAEYDLDGLTLPKIAEAFVWPGFRVMRVEADGSLGSLDQDDPRPEHLATWLTSWLNSPDGCEAPLLILGHPGAGKSLLTRVFAGHLSTSAHTPLRIELRALDDPSALPRDQLVAGVNREIGGDLVWSRISEAAGPGGVVALFDGYDELLQTTGQMHRNYLTRIAEFQQEQNRFEGPAVRAIVTSRPALIRYCQFPPGTLVIKLEPFDRPRRAAWTKAWNRANADLFAAPGRTLFQVPASPHLLEMAGQPLLLLMLALYDGGKGELAEAEDLDEAALYERLLRRFVRRELSKAKDEEFSGRRESDQEKRIEKEMRRLGIVAAGMFHRGRQDIGRDELAGDLRFLDDPNADVLDDVGPASKLFNSFFFLHRPRSQGGDQGQCQKYEFLHPTFGEYLLARLIGDTWSDGVLRLWKAQDEDDDTAARDMRQAIENVWSDRKGLNFALPYGLLGSRPKVLELLARAWPAIRARRLRKMQDKEVDQLQDTLAHALLGEVLGARRAPDWAVAGAHRPGCSPPGLLHRLATVSLNLVLLRTACAGGRWTCRLASELPEDAIECPGWRSLGHLWRVAYPTDALARLRAVMVADFDPSASAVQVKLDGLEMDEDIKRGAALQLMARALGDARLFVLSTFVEGDHQQVQRALEMAESACPEWAPEVRAELIRQLEWVGPTEALASAAEGMPAKVDEHPQRTVFGARSQSTGFAPMRAVGLTHARTGGVGRPPISGAALDYVSRDLLTYPSPGEITDFVDDWLTSNRLTDLPTEFLLRLVTFATETRAFELMPTLLRELRARATESPRSQLWIARSLPVGQALSRRYGIRGATQVSRRGDFREQSPNGAVMRLVARSLQDPARIANWDDQLGGRVLYEVDYSALTLLRSTVDWFERVDAALAHGLYGLRLELEEELRRRDREFDQLL